MQGVANPGVFFISTVNVDEEPNPDVASSATRASSIELHPSLHPSSALSAMSIDLTSLDREERGHADSESLVSEQQEQFRGMFSCPLTTMTTAYAQGDEQKPFPLSDLSVRHMPLRPFMAKKCKSK